MASFEISWERKQEVSIEIEAETPEEAYNIWTTGDYGSVPDVNDEDIIGNYVEVDGETYYLNRFEKVRFG
ncbi:MULTISPECIES: hypothetical protein [Enterococcus]|jgi:hypothetical protein|uniref:Uncharacterized protein n=1 Tax=Enterococcus raffinosus ATCC 49464 TaxID=1158602 RepID=R2R001_9ENTE|nr:MULTISPECIES: hypothetical protein [Enterococcus]EOH77035.1 hypothetical protein UAK_02608 [Enterococcus raffinosus ATCC 49464]EOT75728.1 hypothetical protein I590_02552 [Enterococcus raffinosus ATCC 49464]UXK03335.1 hypothetical protein N7K38_11810 [Enterococcus raffinosus]